MHLHPDDYNDVEVQVLKSYGVGLDVHSCFIAVWSMFETVTALSSTPPILTPLGIP